MIYWQMKFNKIFDHTNEEKTDGLSKQDSVVKTTFTGFFLVMAFYYGWRMFALTPWYDELYTYYCFISKGPIYAGIHWPLPNNHVGYSVLSACLDYFGNSYIGLRGISYVCALANMCLLFALAKRYLESWLSLGTVVLYVSMNLVNQMAVQGRGYTLGITCFLTAALCMSRICEQKIISRRIWILYIAALILGLYAVSSHVYFVVPLCLAGGVYLLAQGKWESGREQKKFLHTVSGSRLIKLITASLIAAAGTLGLYTIIWLSIGSNLLVKNAESAYYGMGHVKLIFKAPFDAVKTGAQYMLDTPYIQSEERAGFAGRLLEWLAALARYFYGDLTPVWIVVWCAGVIILAVVTIMTLRSEKRSRLFLELLLLMELCFIPICLLIQCKRPYYRVFTYAGILLALLTAVMIDWGLGLVQKRMQEAGGKYLHAAVLFCILLSAVKYLCFSGCNEQYSYREYEIQDVLEHAGISKAKKLCVTDCNQEYLLYFLYGIRCENREIEGTDVLLLDKRMADEDFKEMVWEFYHYYGTIPWEYVNESMAITYENNDYVLYLKKE